MPEHQLHPDLAHRFELLEASMRELKDVAMRNFFAGEIERFRFDGKAGTTRWLDDHGSNALSYAIYNPNYFRVFVGLEDLSFPMLCIGACGLMNAVGNVQPRKVAELYEQTVKGNLEAARKLHYELAELNDAVFFDTNPIPIKYILMKMGVLDRNEHRLPMAPATPEVAARLDGVMKRAGLVANGKKAKKNGKHKKAA